MTIENNHEIFYSFRKKKFSRFSVKQSKLLSKEINITFAIYSQYGGRKFNITINFTSLYKKC